MHVPPVTDVPPPPVVHVVPPPPPPVQAFVTSTVSPAWDTDDGGDELFAGSPYAALKSPPRLPTTPPPSSMPPQSPNSPKATVFVPARDLFVIASSRPVSPEL